MRILCNILVLLFVTTAAVGQQINPVPDYIFRNQMSVGRNAVTDTAAYMSIGPRFGATKGFMPPMVVDTNAVTGTKRNGLLIFSVQLNNFAYWDSTTSRFRKITAEAIVDSLLYSTRAWRQKGDDSLGNLIGLRVRFTDTASMLSPYLRKADTTAMLSPYYRTVQATAALAGKVNISDTATMLSPYLRKADTSTMLSPYLRKIDTTAMLNPYVRIAGYGLTKGTQTLSVDTGLMATRVRVQKAIDSLGAVKGAGTVTSVAAGTGMSFTTITTTGSVSADTVALATRAWRQKGIDSLAALEVSISDTATMLNPYIRGTGTLNYVPKFTATGRRIGDSQIFDNGLNIGISNTSPLDKLDLNGSLRIRKNTPGFANSQGGVIDFVDTTIFATTPTMRFASVGSNANAGLMTFLTGTSLGTVSERMRITSAGRLLIGTTTEGTNTVDIAGTLRSTQGANFATSSGSVGIGTTSPSEALHVVGRGRFTTIDSTSSPINLLTSDVNGVIRKTSIAASGGVTGSGTINYIPKFTASTAIGNANMYDSSSTIKIRKSHIGNGASENYAMDMNVDGIGGRGLLISLRDSSTTGARNAFLIRRTPFSGIVPAPDYGTGFRMEVADGRGNIKFAGSLSGFVTDSSLSNFSTQLGFGVMVKNTPANLMFLRPDSALRLTKLAGSGTRNVAANANGDLVIADVSSSTDSVKMRSSTVTAASGWNFAEETANNTQIDQVVKFVDLSGLETVKLNTVLYKTTNTFTTNAWVTVATVPSGFRPNNVIYGSLPNLVDGADFQAQNNTDFTATAQYSGGTSFRIKANGNVDVFVQTVDSSADLSGSNYVIFPIVVSYPILTVLN